MTAITIGSAATTVPASVRPATKSVFARVWASFVEARMRQAEREIAQHSHLLPGRFQAVGEHLSPRSEKDLPFAR